MKKTTLLSIALVILVVLNLGLMGTIFFGPKHGPHGRHDGKMRPEREMGRRPREIIIQNLGFNNTQVQQYDALIKTHREKIDTLDKGIRDTKQKLYALLQSDFKPANRDSLIAQINVYQKQIEETHFNHFQDIKNICTPQQKKSFEVMAPEFPRLFHPGPMRN